MGLQCLLSSTFTQVFGNTDGSNLHTKAGVSCKEMEGGISGIRTSKEDYPYGFHMPVHYPRYTKADYEKMEEWRIDMLLREYGFSVNGATVDEKRAFAMGAFLWPDQL